jgi:hypothetical protein
MPIDSRRVARLSAVAVFLALPVAAAAQTLEYSGYVDFRAVMPSTQRDWSDGGLGKLRYDGGGPDPFAEAAIDATLKLASGLSAQATLRAAPDQKTALDVTEAYVKYVPIDRAGWRWTSKFGFFIPPVSLENESVGWTSPWTLTPSAINSWVGEELRTVGGETQIEWRYRSGAVALTGAVLGWNDPAGVVLADRGWAFDDRPTGLFGQVRLPDASAVAQRHAGPLTEAPFREIDNEPGWYAGVTWRGDGLGRVAFLRYENRANPALARGGEFAWRTEFNSLGVEADLGDVVLLGQAMSGWTEIAPTPSFNSVTDFQAGYLLAGYYFGDFRIAGRIDVFATQENHPGASPHLSERGHAFTVSGAWTPVRWLRVSAELLDVVSFRAQRAIVGLNPAANEVQIQLSTRLFF